MPTRYILYTNAPRSYDYGTHVSESELDWRLGGYPMRRLVFADEGLRKYQEGRNMSGLFWASDNREKTESLWHAK